MITTDIFALVRQRYGLQASWAVWGSFGARPRDNMGDLSIFDEPALNVTLHHLHVQHVLVGLNISIQQIEKPLSNFHGKNGEVYKLRFALHNTPLWGSYMTDILKDFPEPRAAKIESALETEWGKKLEQDNVDSFRQELDDIGAHNATLVALGHTVYKILKNNFGETKNIIRIPHYGYRVDQTRYRDLVHARL